MKFVFFLQTLNLHPNKQNTKVRKNTLFQEKKRKRKREKKNLKYYNNL
jgi:hypothetical protein